MKTIKIYKSKFAPIMGIVGFFAFMAGCMLAYYHTEGASTQGIIIPAMMFALYAAFSIVAFAIRKPKLIITDYSVMINTYIPWEVYFDDVDSFYPTSYKGQQVIGIRYKKDVEAGKSIEEVEYGIALRARTLLNPGEPYDIYVQGLAKKPQEILDLLNQRLKS